MKHIDLFSGIGGFALATEMVWGDVDHVFVDNDSFCQKILKKHWPNSKIYGDIRTFTANARGEESRGLPGGKWETISEAWEGNTDILTGGFPCQPFSAAGRRKGTADDRYLWPEMFRVIREFKPTWVIAENVRGLVTWNDGMVLEQVCVDLESEGYEVQPLIIPAVALNAPHRRDRVWIIANRTQFNGKRPKSVGGSGGKSETRIGNRNSDASDPGRKRPKKQQQQTVGNEQYSWNDNWLKVATELCRVDDGLPTELDGFKFTKSAHRRERLKSLGNAIVPQVAIEIMRAIKLADGKY